MMCLRQINVRHRHWPSMLVSGGMWNLAASGRPPPSGAPQYRYDRGRLRVFNLKIFRRARASPLSALGFLTLIYAPSTVPERLAAVKCFDTILRLHQRLGMRSGENRSVPLLGPCRLLTRTRIGNIRDSGSDPPRPTQTAARTSSLGGRRILGAGSCVG